MSDTPTSENEAQVAPEANEEATAAATNEEVVETAEAPAAADETANDQVASNDFDDEEEEVETTLYRVVVREDEQVIDGRIEAVEKAKEISIETGQSVLVERTDGRVKMNFRDGALIDYVLSRLEKVDARNLGLHFRVF